MSNGNLLVIGSVDDETIARALRTLETEDKEIAIVRLSTTEYQELYDFQNADFWWFLKELTGNEVFMSDKITDVPEIKRVIRALPGPITFPCGISIGQEAVVQELVFNITQDGGIFFKRGAMLRDWASKLDLPVLGLAINGEDEDGYEIDVEDAALTALGIDDDHVYYVGDEDELVGDPMPDFSDPYPW